MPHPMRRYHQRLSDAACLDILDRGTSGVMALLGEDGYPYAVPLSYVRRDDRLYFHSARAGHKLEAIAHCDRASFCVVDQDRVVPKDYTSYFRSVIAFGTVRVLEDRGEKGEALRLLAAKYFPDDPEGREAEVQKTLASVTMLELTTEHITGKEAIELIREREQHPEP